MEKKMIKSLIWNLLFIAIFDKKINKELLWT